MDAEEGNVNEHAVSSSSSSCRRAWNIRSQRDESGSDLIEMELDTFSIGIIASQSVRLDINEGTK